MHDRTEWHRGANTHGRKKNLTEFARPCATCGKPFSIFVNQKIADGDADSNSFALKNCEEHRRNYRPAKQDPVAELAELKTLYTAQAAEIQQLKARIAAFELFSAPRVRQSRHEPYHATGQPMPRTPADGDWEGD